MTSNSAQGSTRVDPNSPTLHLVEVNKGMYFIVMASLSVVAALFMLLAFLTWNVVLLDFGLKFNLGYWFLVAIVIYVAGSLLGNDLSTSELGVIYLFGSPVWRCKGAGLKFVPWGLMNLDRLPADMQEIHAPGKKDQIFWGDDEAPVPPGMTRAIRMTTKAPDEGENKPLDAQLTVGLGYFVLWTIKDAVQFRAHIRTTDEADSQLRLISTMSLSEYIGTVTPGEAIANQAPINRKLDNRIRERTRGWGVEINETGLTEINYSHGMASAMRDRAKALVQKETRITNAEAEARETELKGKADGEAARARTSGEILGRVDGMKAMKDGLGVDGASVLAHEAVRGVLKDVDTMLLGGQDGVKDILGTLAAGRAMFQNRASKEEKGGEGGERAG